MLVLSRKQNKRLLIGDDIEITVVEIRGDKVTLGIEAPKGVRVDREEVAQEKAREKERAAYVRRRMNAGAPLRKIEDELDQLENQHSHQH
jgi:carbon storage regulator